MINPGKEIRVTVIKSRARQVIGKTIMNDRKIIIGIAV